MSSAVSLDREPSSSLQPRRRVLGRAIPAEGENGLFTQSWFPLCLVSEVPPGKVLGVEFLDGRVIVSDFILSLRQDFTYDFFLLRQGLKQLCAQGNTAAPLRFEMNVESYSGAAVREGGR